VALLTEATRQQSPDD